MLDSERMVSKGEWILVTGANGYIASHVVDILLNEGYNVRGTVRIEKPWLQKFFDEKYGASRFETIVIESLQDATGFEGALQGVSAVAHIATDVSGNTDPDAVISRVVAGTRCILEAAAKTPSVKRVVLTSSTSAALLPEPNKEGVVDESTWNDRAISAAFNGEGSQLERPKIVYAASKTEDERAFWKWFEEKRPSFSVNTVLPYLVLGRALTPEVGGSTWKWCLELLKGNPLALHLFPPEWYVDVRDTARLHVVALLEPKITSERLFACAAPFTWGEVLPILHKLRPEAPLPKPLENEGRDLFNFNKVSTRAERLLQSFFGVPGWTRIETILAGGVGEVV